MKELVLELLIFILHKIDILGEVMLHKLCEEHYSDRDIEVTKSKLASYCGENGVTTRLSVESNKSKHLQDIVQMLQTVELKVLPVYVAKDLGKLLSVIFNYVDVTSAMRDAA